MRNFLIPIVGHQRGAIQLADPRPHLSAQSEEDEHEEEEQRPQGGDGEQGEGLWVGHEGQARSVVGHLRHGDVQVVRHEAQDGEDDEAGVHAGGTVGHADDDAVSVWGHKHRICNYGAVTVSLLQVFVIAV